MGRTGADLRTPLATTTVRWEAASSRGSGFSFFRPCFERSVPSTWTHRRADKRKPMHLQGGAYTGSMSEPAAVLELFRSKGLRMTPQRRAIVAEIMATQGHISATDIARRVQDRVPGVNPSTVYRTLETLEDLGVLSHAHRESGPEYHRRAESRHVHLTCSRCGADDELSLKEARSLAQLVHRHHGFRPDLSHFAISGLCAACQRVERSRN